MTGVDKGINIQHFGSDPADTRIRINPESHHMLDGGLRCLSIVELLLSASLYVSKRGAYYGRPLSVSGRPCYVLPMFLFIYLFLWPPYFPAVVNGGS